MNFSRGLNLPKTGYNWALAEILKNLIQFLVEIAIFEPRLKFFQFGLKIKWKVWFLFVPGETALVYRRGVSGEVKISRMGIQRT